MAGDKHLPILAKTHMLPAGIANGHPRLHHLSQSPETPIQSSLLSHSPGDFGPNSEVGLRSLYETGSEGASQGEGAFVMAETDRRVGAEGDGGGWAVAEGGMLVSSLSSEMLVRENKRSNV
ncbi:hypothetical protein CRG98_023115 [Punica granatum]|uniref:Uncharacterized protein n=1 Tax=Punica granatum TaxID=22663 RepID=A0A2I0JJP5_PUNGR|nr:hypothetical protein CRG98_023115 [Punica granatum]